MGGVVWGDSSLPSLLPRTSWSTVVWVSGPGKRAVRGFTPRGCHTAWAAEIDKTVTWLILPVVICLSQRLSHACLSINNFIL